MFLCEGECERLMIANANELKSEIEMSLDLVIIADAM